MVFWGKFAFDQVLGSIPIEIKRNEVVSFFCEKVCIIGNKRVLDMPTPWQQQQVVSLGVRIKTPARQGPGPHSKSDRQEEKVEKAARVFDASEKKIRSKTVTGAQCYKTFFSLSEI